jgi:TPR repeat protein
VDEGAGQGCEHCKGVLSLCLYPAWGAQQYCSRAEHFARSSAAAGSKYGQFALAFHLQFIGSKNGQFALGSNLGCRPFASDGVRPEVVALFQQSAAQGVSVAQWCLGLCYETGNGVPKNNAEACSLFGMAALQRFPHAYASMVQFSGEEDNKIYLLKKAVDGGLLQLQGDLDQALARKTACNARPTLPAQQQGDAAQHGTAAAAHNEVLLSRGNTAKRGRN